MIPSEEREFAQFFHDLFHQSDSEEYGYLHITAIKDLIVQADLGLSRLQMMSILSEAVEDERGNVDYAAFASTVAGMLFAMFRQRNVRASDLASVRMEEDFNTILGLDEMAMTEAIKNTLTNLDPDTIGKVDRLAARNALSEAMPDVSSQQLQALMALALPDETGFIYYEDIIVYGFRTLQYIKQQELIARR
jgi:Ca2+-binding EF-hand superfamily protein